MGVDSPNAFTLWVCTVSTCSGDAVGVVRVTTVSSVPGATRLPADVAAVPNFASEEAALVETRAGSELTMWVGSPGHGRVPLTR